jgi:hypothetical protein
MRPDQYPRTLKSLCGFGQAVFRIIVLPKTLLHISGLAAIITTTGFALYNVNPSLHDKKSQA